MKSAGFVDAKGLPDSPLDAAAEFHRRIVPAVREVVATSSDLSIVFDARGPMHSNWRLAAIQELAREAAPCRVNGVEAPQDNLDGTARALQFLRDSPGITGQMIVVDANPSKND